MAQIKVEVLFDTETQDVNLQFDPEQFKKWGFLAAVLGMAHGYADQRNRLAVVQGLAAEEARRQAEAQQAVILAQEFNGRRK